jgi:replicative DNA helicase
MTAVTIAERALVACALLALQSGDAEHAAVEAVRSLGGAAWSDREAADVAAALRHDDRPGTLVALAATLSPDDPTGPLGSLEAWADEAATAETAVHFHRLIARTHERRMAAEALREIIAALDDPRVSVRQATEVARQALGRVPALAADTHDVQRVTPGMLQAMAQRMAAPVRAVPTFLPTWNDASRGHGGGEGLARGWHIVAGGASGTGKSLVALNLTSSALLAGYSVAWVSLEMSRDQLMSRLLAIVSGHDVRALEPGRAFSPGIFQFASTQLQTVCQETGAWLSVRERPARDLPGVIAQMRAAADAGASLIVLDYLQLVQVDGEQGADAIKRISNSVQQVAYECDVVTLALSQYNRAMSFGNERPSKHGLTGGSAIENDADQVVLIDRTQQVVGDLTSDFRLILDKNRHGPQPDVGVRMDRRTLRWTERDLGPDQRDQQAAGHGIGTGGLRLERGKRGRP